MDRDSGKGELVQLREQPHRWPGRSGVEAPGSARGPSLLRTRAAGPGHSGHPVPGGSVRLGQTGVPQRHKRSDCPGAARPEAISPLCRGRLPRSRGSEGPAPRPRPPLRSGSCTPPSAGGVGAGASLREEITIQPQPGNLRSRGPAPGCPRSPGVWREGGVGRQGRSTGEEGKGRFRGRCATYPGAARL